MKPIRLASTASTETMHDAGAARRAGLLVLLIVTAVWGTTFPAMKQISGQLSALEIILVRSVIACVVLAPLVVGARRNEWRWGMSIGAVLFCAFYLQVAGLASTSSNRNAFVTGLNVIIVPLLALALGQRLRWTLLAGATLGVLGLFGLFYEQSPWSRGDTLTLAGAFVYAIYVLMFEFSARSRPALRPARIALIQAATMGLLSLGFLCVFAPPDWAELTQRARASFAVLLYLGVVASALMVWFQTWAQHRVRAVEAALIYGLEPVCAAVAAIWWINETMAPRAIAGGALIVLGVMLAQWDPRPRARIESAE